MTCRQAINQAQPSPVVHMRDYARQDATKRLLCEGENFLRLQETVEICVDHIVCALVVGLGLGYVIWGF